MTRPVHLGEEPCELDGARLVWVPCDCDCRVCGYEWSTAGDNRTDALKQECPKCNARDNTCYDQRISAWVDSDWRAL
jgi:predicted Zn-ribbon and HTH transcriptional regulator